MPKLTLAAAAVLILTNLVVLAGVAYNRSATPVRSIELTERELSISPSILNPGKNSGTSLTLEWYALGLVDDADNTLHSVRLPPSLHTRTPAWLDTEKLVELGFDIQAIERDIDKYKHHLFHLSTEVILVLEYGGDTWQKAVEIVQSSADSLRQEIENNPDDTKRAKQLEYVETRVEGLQTTQSRLYVIDAGLDKRALLDRYSDSNRYLFARGQIGLRWNAEDQQIDGRIRGVAINNVHAPLPYSRVIAELARADRSRRKARIEPPGYRRTEQPRYRVRMNIGKRLEPWVESITLVDEKAP